MQIKTRGEVLRIEVWDTLFPKTFLVCRCFMSVIIRVCCLSRLIERAADACMRLVECAQQVARLVWYLRPTLRCLGQRPHHYPIFAALQLQEMHIEARVDCLARGHHHPVFAALQLREITKKA